MIQVMDADGYVDETLMVNAILEVLLERISGKVIDILSMSFGYYHEAPDDARTDASLLTPLTALGKLGVLMVAAAGNDATSRPMFPASFAIHPNNLPLLSVGAKNPNGTIALFSNAGNWVRVYETGASVLSSLPTTFNASLQPTARAEFPEGSRRESIDPDDFHGGFATWSGTSFATPIVAGKLARHLLRSRDPKADPNVLGSAAEALQHILAEPQPRSREGG
jgi:subtilisin family serine protease